MEPMRWQMKEMIRRKQMVRRNRPEDDDEIERITEKVQRSGGLTTDEVYGLMAY